MTVKEAKKKLSAAARGGSSIVKPVAELVKPISRVVSKTMVLHVNRRITRCCRNQAKTLKQAMHRLEARVTTMVDKKVRRVEAMCDKKIRAILKRPALVC